jgi:uncharacterized protein
MSASARSDSLACPSHGCERLLAAIATHVVSLAATHAITPDILRLYVLGLPAMLTGLWVGFKLYGKLDDAAFRTVILVRLLIAGLGLIAPRGV